MFFKTAPSTHLEISVIIPVKDEEQLILQCLEALRLQTGEDGLPLPKNLFEILILANNCNDQTVDRIYEYQRLYPSFPLYVEKITFPGRQANVGNARRLLMDIAWKRFKSINKPNGIIASTDGDTRVDNQWMNEIIKEINKGSEVVGGEIITKMDNSPARSYYLKDLRYQNLIIQLESLTDPQTWNPWPAHFHCFGASMAIKSNIYSKAGRMPPIACLEDVAFIKSLELIDAKIRRTPKVKVYTSSRKVGRVEKGFSQQLAWFESLGEEKQDRWVESAESILSRIKIKKSLRNLWDSKNLDYTTKQLDEDYMRYIEPYLSEWLKETIYFGQLWMLVLNELGRNQWFEQWEPVRIDDAIEKLKGYISGIKCELKLAKTRSGIQRKPLPHLKNGQA